MELIIRPLETHLELAQAEALQQVVWGGPPLVPSATMRAVLEVGGSVLGAWLGDELAGFCFGFPGWRRRQPVPPGLEGTAAGGDPGGAAAERPGPAGSGVDGAGSDGGGPAGGPGGLPAAAMATLSRAAGSLLFPPPVPGEPGEREPVFHSDLLAVRPELRDRGIGRRLKLAQREWALRQGLHLITWTYDPLQARNGYLNLTRLGGLARRYVREFYGGLDDELNRGLPADRLVIEWYLASRRVARRAGAEGTPAAGDGAPGVATPGGKGAGAGPGGWDRPGGGTPGEVAAAGGTAGAVMAAASTAGEPAEAASFGAAVARGGDGTGQGAPDAVGPALGATAVPDLGAVPVLNRVREDGGIPTPVDWRAPQGETEAGVLIPARFVDWRRDRPQWGLEWRFHLRQVLEACLEAGYLLDRCVPTQAGSTVMYVLARRATT